MLLCLPSRLGGRQLPIPEHNVAIPITERARSHTRRKTLVCDLYWKEFRLDVECDSTRHHSSKRQLGIDSNRRIILDAMEYKYVGITYWQLENESEFEDVVPKVISTSSLDDAMRAAQAEATEGDVVLLSPACASFDLFKNYEQRGELFKLWVKENVLA